MVLAVPSIEFAAAMNTDVPDNIVVTSDTETRLYTPADGSGTITIPVSRVEAPSHTHEAISHTHTENNDDGTHSGSMRWSDDDRSVKVSWDGKFTLSDDERSIAAMDDEGMLKISTSNGDSRRRIRIHNDEGTLETTYWENGKKTEFDTDGEEWLAETIQNLVQHTAIGIEDRVSRYLKQGGTDGALERMNDLQSDYVKRMYTIQMIRQAAFSEAQLKELLNNIRSLESDYEVRLTLLEMLDTGMLNT